MHISRRCPWASRARPREFGMPWLWLIGCCLLPWSERSALAVQASRDAGLDNVCHLVGGIDAWIEAGGPVET
ncbi:MAG: rhodanese-like domain-containing protein [Planctomycetes bacterium]|nr:rhodanese-like domain-containing protein [Planctomycetota bacterium]